MAAIYLYSLADAKSTQVTDGMSDAENPVFDKNGKYLYFTASTNSGAAMQPDIESFSRPVTASVYWWCCPRAKPSPLAPESDDEKKKDDDQERRRQERRREDKDKDKDKSAEKVEVKIDLEKIGQRILALPMPARPVRGAGGGQGGRGLCHRSAGAANARRRRSSRCTASI